MAEKYVLEVLNPRNAMKIDGYQGLTAPRVTTLDGIRIAIVSEKPDGCLYLNQLQKLLQEAGFGGGAMEMPVFNPDSPIWVAVP